MKLHAGDTIILRHLDYGDADRIVTFLTAESGICRGFARGARGSRKRFGAALEPFSRTRLHWKNAHGSELLSLREAELLDQRSALRQDLSTLMLASYGCELLEALFGEGHAQPELFPLLNGFLDHLAHGDAAAEARLLLELRLLHAAGYIPHLLHCAECGGALETQVSFNPGRGGSLCRARGAGTPATVALTTLGTLSRCLHTPPALFAGFRFGPTTLNEGGRLLHAALNLHLPRPLKSLSFLEQIHRF